MPFTPVYLIDVLGIYGLAEVAVASMILVGALLWLRRDHGWSVRLLVLGAASLFIVATARFAFVFSFTHGWLQRTPFLNGCVVVPSLSKPVEIAELMSYCLWIGLIWSCVRLARPRPNHAMERTADRRTLHS